MAGQAIGQLEAKVARLEKDMDEVKTASRRLLIIALAALAAAANTAPEFVKTFIGIIR